MVGQSAGDRFELRSYLRTLRRRRLTIVLVTVGVTLAAFGVSLLQTRVYTAGAEIVLQSSGTESVFSDNASINAAANRTVETEIRVIKSDAVRSAVRRTLGYVLPVQAARVGETEAIAIKIASTNAARAALVANSYADAYMQLRKSQAVGDLKGASDQIKAKIDTLQGEIDGLDRRLSSASPADRPAVEATIGPRYSNLLTEQSLLAQKLDALQVDATLQSGGVQLVSAATTPGSPSSPKPVRNALAGMVVGLALGIGLAFVREHLDDSITTKEDLARSLPSVPVLGVVPLSGRRAPKDPSDHLEQTRTGAVPTAEAYRSLRAAVQLLGVERPIRTLQVTSPGPSEGKTTIVANLGVVLAAAGQRVVVVDCDLRRPSLHRLFGLDNDIGFTSVFLSETTPLASVRRSSVDPSLYIVCSGPSPANPSELLSSNRTAEFIFELQSEFDVVLVDSPPVLPVADAVVLAAWVEATVLVASAGVTTGQALADAAERLRQVEARIVGAVLNRATADATYYGYRYGYGYTDVGKHRWHRSASAGGPSS